MRNVAIDLYRVVAIVFVVLGHWLIAAMTYRDGEFGRQEPLVALPWTQWLTWTFQVVPVFFVVAGYASALSWTRWQQDTSQIPAAMAAQEAGANRRTDRLILLRWTRALFAAPLATIDVALPPRWTETMLFAGVAAAALALAKLAADGFAPHASFPVFTSLLFGAGLILMTIGSRREPRLGAEQSGAR